MRPSPQPCLLLYGQKQSNAVTPAVAAAMMPVAGALLEVIFEKKIFSITFIIGLVFAVIGGLIAAGVEPRTYDMSAGDGTQNLKPRFIYGIGCLCTPRGKLYRQVTNARLSIFPSKLRDNQKHKHQRKNSGAYWSC